MGFQTTELIQEEVEQRHKHTYRQTENLVKVQH